MLDNILAFVFINGEEIEEVLENVRKFLYLLAVSNMFCLLSLQLLLHSLGIGSSEVLKDAFQGNIVIYMVGVLVSIPFLMVDFWKDLKSGYSALAACPMMLSSFFIF